MLAHIASSKPNVLFLITDQQRSDSVGYVNGVVKTPNLDILASKSVVCTNAFVQSPQCQPSRASILTGRYPTAHRVWWNEIAISPNERTLANYLSGYTTGYFGKLHFDGGPHSKIARHYGFDHNFLMEDWQHWIAAKHLFNKGMSNVANEFYSPMSTNTWTGEFSQRTAHHEEIITDKAIEFIKNAAGPWYAMVGFHGPHPPYASPKEFNGLYPLAAMSVPQQRVVTHSGHEMSDDDWRRLKKQYYGSISWIDDCIGRLLGAVNSNTIIVFTSDHGDILGDHGHFSKGMYAYDGVIKVPLLMMIPGMKHRFYHHLVQSIDILPTILNILGMAAPAGVQGSNLLAGFESNSMVNDHVVSMIGHSPRLRMIRTTTEKYWVCGDEEFSFDLISDPQENFNRQPTPELRLKLLRALIACEDPLPVPSKFAGAN